MKQFLLIVFMFSLCSLKAQKSNDIQDNQNNSFSVLDSTKTKSTSNRYFALGRGGSYGGLGLKLGKFKKVNERFQSTYIIGGLGAYELNESYKLGVVASVGKKFYFPKVLFIDGRVGINEYVVNGAKILPALGIKCLGGVEFRSRWIGISLGLGIQQNIVFDQTTRPSIEIGFLFGNWQLE